MQLLQVTVVVDVAVKAEKQHKVKIHL